MLDLVRFGSVASRVATRDEGPASVVVGNGVADLDEREVYIVVPPDGEDIILE